MKVMQLLSSLLHDEAERAIYCINHNLIKAGHQSIIIAAATPNDVLVTRLIRDGSIYYSMDMKKKSWWSLRYVLMLKKIILAHKPDIIHVHSRTPAWVLHWSLKLIEPKHRPKTIGTVYGFYPLTPYTHALLGLDIIISASKTIDDYLKQAVQKKYAHHLIRPLQTVENFCQNLQNKQIALSTHIKDTGWSDKIACINRGVDVRNYPYRHHPSVHWLLQVFAEFEVLEHKKWLLFPYSIGAGSGASWLIDIAGNLQDDFKDLHLLIMDDMQDDEHFNLIKEEFLQRIHTLGLTKYFSFIGKNPSDLKEWLSAANVVLLLCDAPESIGMKALKALHLGTPVLGWNTGALADILPTMYPKGLIKQKDAKTLTAAIKIQLQAGTRPDISYSYTVDEVSNNTLLLYQSLHQYSNQNNASTIQNSSI